MKLGIVGLPNVGKSTLFNSLTKAGAESANYPFCTIDPNIGIVPVPDERLGVLAKMHKSAKIVPAAIEFVDIAGLVKGASKGEGLGNQFLSNIREVDAIIHVVRCFEDSNIVHVDGSIDPLRDIETINLELLFSDLEILERRLAKLVKSVKGDKTQVKEKELVERLVFHNIMCVGATVAQQADKLMVVATVAKKDVDNAAIEKIVSALVKQNMAVDKVENTDSVSWDNVYLSVKPRFNVTFGVSSVAKDGNEISGDTHSVLRTDNGKCIVALCDGMGSGDKAEQMSATSIGLVESFYRAGFDSDVILSCVNKLLTTSGNEVFCAVDIVAIDLYDGLTDFIKLGASVGLVKCQDKVEIVAGSSLPLGVLDEMKPSVTKKALTVGDVIVLMSDGVADCFKDPEAIAGVFSNVSLNVPQSIAEVILNKALKLVGNKARDDMTVLVAKIS